MAVTYEENFEKTVLNYNEETKEYITSEVRKVHSVDKGWFVPEPKVIKNPDGSATLIYPIKKYDNMEEAQAKYDIMMAEKEQQDQRYSR